RGIPRGTVRGSTAPGGAAPARRGAGGDGGDDADRRRVRRAAGRDRRRGRARGAGGDARGLLTAAPALPLVTRSTWIRRDPTDRSPTARPSQHVDQTRPHRPISYRSSLAARRSVLPRAAVGFHAQADPERDPSPEEEQEHQGAEEDRGAGGPGHQADQQTVD